VFTRIAQARDWIATIDPDASGANGLNVPAFTARQVGVDRLRIDWDAPATGPLPVRYRFFLGVSGAQLFDRAFDDIAEFAFLSNIVFEFRVASVGGTSRFVSINNVVPRRPGARVYRRLRLEVIDEDGNRAVSPLKLVLAPVDARRPTMPGLPRVTRRSSKGIQLYWNRSADNDCVRQYVIQARRASERFVARKVVVNDRCMNVGGTIFDPDMLGESGSIMSQSKWKPRIAGRYFVRVIAIDRAGNRRIGRSSRVVVRPNDTFALGDSRSDEEDDFEAEYEDE
jgi:hypothetical protein